MSLAHGDHEPSNQIDMTSPESEFIRAEMQEVERIVRNECWLEGERRGGAVDPHDPDIRMKVADIILGGAGEELRRSLRMEKGVPGDSVGDS